MDGDGTMKLKEYMGTHDGEYLVAETTRTIAIEDLDGSLAELEVEAHLLGDDTHGQRRFHLYATEHPVHLVTHIERMETGEGRPRGTTAAQGLSTR
jgi:hypothetical protein